MKKLADEIYFLMEKVLEVPSEVYFIKKIVQSNDYPNLILILNEMSCLLKNFREKYIMLSENVDTTKFFISYLMMTMKNSFVDFFCNSLSFFFC